jgi:predicted dienelactone hydrolase
VTADGRVKMLVLLAPATVWFREPGALDSVRVPVLMMTGDKDRLTPSLHAEIVKSGVKGVEHHVIPNAGHFSFLSPFPAAMQKPEFAPSQDPEGFDRAGFHPQMNLEILNFLHRVL